MSYQLGFLVESFAVESDGSASRQQAGKKLQLPWIPLPNEGASRLLLSNQSPPQQLPDDAPPTQNGHELTVVFEQVLQDYQPYLAMLAPSGEMPLRLNGMPASPVSILQLRDQVQIDTSYVLHVTGYVRPHTGRPDQKETGSTCLICRTPIVENQTIYRCPNCGLPLHHGSADGPEHDRLECALTATRCPRCPFPLLKKEGYAYVPEL